MRHILISSLLFAVMLSQGIHIGEIRFNEVEVSFGRERPSFAFAGKDIEIRVYNDWQNDPRAYQVFSIPLKYYSVDISSIKVAFPEIKDSAVIAIIENDQKDKEISEFIAGSIFVERFDKLNDRLSRLSNFLRGGKTAENIFFDDALGDLIPSAEVDIFIQDVAIDGFRIFIGKAQTNGGLLEVPSLEDVLKKYYFYISHANYGAALVERYMKENHILTPLLHRESPAYQRAIRGRVVDSDGNPVVGAVIECQSIRTLGEGLISPLHGWTYRSLTSGEGTFCFYLPNEQNSYERGYLIPPKSKYHVRIDAPKELGLLPYTEPIENNGEKLIVMERADHFRIFIFEDADGVITDPSRLQYISVNITRPDKRMFGFGYGDFKDGGFFPLGEYKANMYIPGSEYEFEPVLVNENSPEEIVFKLPDKIIYTGQVIHGLTSQPMSGAFVFAFSGSKSGNLSMITYEQWQALHDLPLEPSLDTPALKPLNEIYVIKKIVRTNELGLFEMEFIPGEIYGFIAVEENYLGIMHRKHALVPDENRIADIPVMKLYPAATVLVTLQAEERISVNPKWIIDTENNPFWVSEFLAADDRSESMFTYDEWLEQNQVQSFHVPAGLNVQIKLQTPYHDQWCPIEIPDVFNLEQGHVVDLGSFTFEPAMEIYVQVVNSRGEPVEGVPVRTLVDKRVWGLAHNSDESGISMFYVIPDSKVEFGVSYRGEDGTIRRETIPCEVKGREEAGQTFKLQLSDEAINSIFE